MAWIPERLMTKTLGNGKDKMWAQHIKQFLMLRCGIETKSQEEMDKGGREIFIMNEYNRWVEILISKYPDAAVHPWLRFTTGTRTIKIDGKYLYRNFQEGLRVFHRDFNTTWEETLKEGVSGKSKEEVWCRFCYLYWCKLKVCVCMYGTGLPVPVSLPLSHPVSVYLSSCLSPCVCLCVCACVCVSGSLTITVSLSLFLFPFLPVSPCLCICLCVCVC